MNSAANLRSSIPASFSSSTLNQSKRRGVGPRNGSGPPPERCRMAPMPVESAKPAHVAGMCFPPAAYILSSTQVKRLCPLPHSGHSIYPTAGTMFSIQRPFDDGE